MRIEFLVKDFFVIKISKIFVLSYLLDGMDDENNW